MDHKLGAVPLFWGGAATPSNTTSPGPRFTSVPSGIFVPFSRLATTVMGENWGLRPLFVLLFKFTKYGAYTIKVMW